VADVPVGLPDKEIIRTCAVIRAFGEINNIPPPQLDVIVDRARDAMLLKPATPPEPPPPPPPPVP